MATPRYRQMPGSYPFADAPFGATSPVLAVAKKHSVIYGDALILYDFVFRGEERPGFRLVFDTYRGQIYEQFRKDIAEVAMYWYPVFHGLDANGQRVV